MELTRTGQAPGLTLDIKKERIRIHRNTLRLLNDPDFFRMLVNPSSKCIIIETCAETSTGAYRASGAAAHNGSLELYSTSLVREIVSCAGFHGSRSVRLLGQQIKGQDAVFFRMDMTLPDLWVSC